MPAAQWHGVGQVFRRGDGEVASGIKGFDPIANNQLDADEINRALESPSHKLNLKHNPSAEGETKKKLQIKAQEIDDKVKAYTS